MVVYILMERGQLFVSPLKSQHLPVPRVEDYGSQYITCDQRDHLACLLVEKVLFSTNADKSFFCTPMLNDTQDQLV